MNNRFGIIQGRLIKPPRNDLLQFFPSNWIDEINIAKTFKFGFIEFFKDRDVNQFCTFFTIKGFITHSVCLLFFIFRQIGIFFFRWFLFSAEEKSSFHLVQTFLFILKFFTHWAGQSSCTFESTILSVRSFDQKCTGLNHGLVLWTESWHSA